MSEFTNAMEIFKLLNKSNCKKCNEKTCLAFAGAVYTGKKHISECPELSKEIIGKYADKKGRGVAGVADAKAIIEETRKKISGVNLEDAAKKLKAPFKNGKITIKCLGKDFTVDSKGNIYTDLHINQWICLPVFNYIIKASEIPIFGKWIPFRELKSGKKWRHLFGQRFEKSLKNIADRYTRFFEYIIEVFNGKQVENHYKVDISLVLHPLNKVPILICYWKAEQGFDSELNLFFDSTAEDIIGIESVYMLGGGLITMFEKLALRHG
ncbi:MAG: DUF3786 domain-containing protein [Deltaproteobacteria bacterium]|nr:DUF3786 domain-containing protein [Deltaproteobacteria bacterium]